MGKGQDYERKLARFLESEGFEVMRSGGSGGGTDSARADLIAGDGSFMWAIEMKFSSSPNVYVDEEEVRNLCAVSDAMGLTAVVGVRWHSRKVGQGVEADWYLVPPEDAERTPSGRFAFNPEWVVEEYPPLAEVIRQG